MVQSIALITATKNDIMTKLLSDDDLVKSIGNINSNFKAGYSIDNTKKIDAIVNDETKKIYRYSLEYTRIFPYGYIPNVLDTVGEGNIIFYYINYVPLRFDPSRNKLFMHYEIIFDIYNHSSCLRTDYSQLRYEFMSERVCKLLLGEIVGRSNHKTIKDVELLRSEELPLMNGRFIGRKLVFSAVGIGECI